MNNIPPHVPESLSMLSENIRFFRKVMDMKQQELAAAVKITTNYLCSLEQRRTAPSVDCLSRIAKKLDQPLPRLLEKHPLFTGLEELITTHGQKEVSIALEIILKNMERGKTNTS